MRAVADPAFDGDDEIAALAFTADTLKDRQVKPRVFVAPGMFYVAEDAGAGASGLDRMASEHRMDELFLRLLATYNAKDRRVRSEEHTSELQSLMRISYAVLVLKKKKQA